MFCRFGSFDDSRPVCAPVSEKLVWTRPVSRIDLRLQRIGVGRLELGQLTPFKHQRRAIDALAGEPLELVDIGRILPALALATALQPKPLVKHLPSCCGDPIVNGPQAAS